MVYKKFIKRGNFSWKENLTKEITFYGKKLSQNQTLLIII